MIMSLVALASLSIATAKVESGPALGDRVGAYEPHHVLGPDKGTDTCPVCKYGSLPAIQVWVGSERRDDLFAISRRLAKLVDHHKAANLKAFMIFVQDPRVEKAVFERDLTGWMKPVGITNVGVAYVPEGHASLADYKINRENAVRNTVIVYRRGFVTAKFVNLTSAQLAELDVAVAAACKD